MSAHWRCPVLVAAVLAAGVLIAGCAGADGTPAASERSGSSATPLPSPSGLPLTVSDMAMVATTADGAPADRGVTSYFKASTDGTKVSFNSYANNLAPNGNDQSQIFLKDLTSGAITRVSDFGGKPSVEGVYSFDMSANAETFAFVTDQDNVVGGRDAVFARKLKTGATSVIPAPASLVYLSADGTKLAFDSWAEDVVPGDSNDIDDVFVKDLVTGTIVRVSTAPDGDQAERDPKAVHEEDGTPLPVTELNSISDDGSKVFFRSSAGNLVPGDRNHEYDYFVKDIASGAISKIDGRGCDADSPGLPKCGAVTYDRRYATVEYRNPGDWISGPRPTGPIVVVYDVGRNRRTVIASHPDADYRPQVRMSEDGTRVFFTWEEALVPEDTDKSAKHDDEGEDLYTARLSN
jgi:hypothetical protein